MLIVLILLLLADGAWRPRGAASDVWFNVLTPPTAGQVKVAMQKRVTGGGTHHAAPAGSSAAVGSKRPAADDERPTKRQRKEDPGCVDLTADTDDEEEEEGQAAPVAGSSVQQQQQQQQQQRRHHHHHQQQQQGHRQRQVPQQPSQQRLSILAEGAWFDDMDGVDAWPGDATGSADFAGFLRDEVLAGGAADANVDELLLGADAPAQPSGSGCGSQTQAGRLSGQHCTRLVNRGIIGGSL